MKRVGRWTWMLLTLLLLLCGTVFAANEKTYIELDQPVELTFSDSVSRYELYLDVPVAGTRVLLDSQSFDWNSNSTGFYIGGSDSANVAGKRIFSVNEAGEQLVLVSYYNLKQGETQNVQFTLREYKNDEQEPNDVTPTELHDGDTISFTLDSGDCDKFAITTTKPGQDIALTIGGFSYASRGRFDIQWQNNNSLIVEKNGVYYLHAGQPGRYTFTLEEWSSSSPSITRTMSVQLLDGDGHEPNDTMQTATPLLIGTDETFTLGGIGDEDWFSFEAAPEDGQVKLYTLRLLDFDLEDPENVCYEIYAPDGTVAASKTKVSFRHTRVFSCSQQGQYAVRLYPKYQYNASVQRAALRIRVEEGGDDPYESNDTWLDAAYIEPGQLISHVLPSGDADWFCFTVPEDHMTLHVSSDCKGIQAMVYIGQTLVEYGDEARVIWSENTSWGKSAENLYWKLGEKGLYYIKMDGGSSEKIYSTMISLLPPDEIEDNDVWYRATPLYEDFVQAFDLSAPNDTEWFRFTVPEGSQKTMLLNITRSQNDVDVIFSLYREAYFSGMDDNSIWANNSYQNLYSQFYISNLEPGTYYLMASNYSGSISDITKLNIQFKLLPQLENDTIATAAPLTEKVWQDVWQDGYFSIGEHKAGEVVQIQRDEGGSKLDGSIDVYDADGKRIKYLNNASFSFQIPADGVYYLRVPASVKFSENEPTRTTRVRYYTHNDKIGAAESITMRPNESVFLDLWFSPDISWSVESEAENLTYDRETGYLTAPDTTEGSEIGRAHV